MRIQAALLREAVARHWRRWLAISAGFVVLYYAGLLLFTVLRFREIPNYVEIYDVVGSYRQILRGTPAWSDAWPILLDEPWLEAGFKDPHYYGVASWSYVLIPPKMVVVFLAFLAAPDVFLKLFGIGLATAIFLDATLVRLVLVPAVMQLLGDRNWWIPAWLEKLLPSLDVERVGTAPAEGRA